MSINIFIINCSNILWLHSNTYKWFWIVAMLRVVEVSESYRTYSQPQVMCERGRREMSTAYCEYNNVTTVYLPDHAFVSLYFNLKEITPIPLLIRMKETIKGLY